MRRLLLQEQVCPEEKQTKSENMMEFRKRFEKHLDELKWLYMELYDDQQHFDELCEKMQCFY